MKKFKIIIITGISGSGKSIAIAAFEDAGFYCVDNMPVELLPKFLDLPVKSNSEIKGLAFVMDLREKNFLSSYQAIFEELKQNGYQFEVLFLDAQENILLKRYSQTRRHHPLTQGKQPLLEGIREEKKLLEPLKAFSSHIIDTSDYNIHDLKSVIFNIAQHSIESMQMQIQILSFGFKHGIPHNADMIMDVRFLKNPYFVTSLKNLDGKNEEVRDYVLNDDATRAFIEKFWGLIDFLIPLYRNEGKAYLTIAVGCTGGVHRSVVIADALFHHIGESGKTIHITHRDIDIKT
ncbi:MAG: RNase adapter RapZ [Desulfobacterales bacterium]|nr:RNase adapter RapZ [Desulfobacterales bacterium]